MPLTPGYGETPLPHDELTALLPEVVEVLDKPVTRAAVYDLEQGLQDRLFDELMPSALDGSLPLNELLSDYFVRDLHARLFGPVWNWAGRWRRLELNIGVAPEQIAVELRNALDTIATGGNEPRTGRLDNWVSSCMPKPCESILSWTEMGAPQGFSLTSCSRKLRIPPSCSTTGTLTRRGISSCFGPTTDTATRPI